MLKRIAVILLAGSLLPGAWAATIIVVRHAERNAGMTPDVLLTPQGEARAKELARVLQDSGIHLIFTTEVRRTQQTAEPLAKQLHLTPVVIPAADIDSLITRLQALPDEETALVVGHSNTVPMIVQKLGGTVPPLSDTEYDRLIIINTSAKKTSVMTLRYGLPAH